MKQSTKFEIISGLIKATSNFVSEIAEVAKIKENKIEKYEFRKSDVFDVVNDIKELKELVDEEVRKQPRNKKLIRIQEKLGEVRVKGNRMLASANEALQKLEE